jgi:hypothetical protein
MGMQWINDKHMGGGWVCFSGMIIALMTCGLEPLQR